MPFFLRTGLENFDAVSYFSDLFLALSIYGISAPDLDPLKSYENYLAM